MELLAVGLAGGADGPQVAWPGIRVPLAKGLAACSVQVHARGGHGHGGAGDARAGGHAVGVLVRAAHDVHARVAGQGEEAHRQAQDREDARDVDRAHAALGLDDSWGAVDGAVRQDDGKPHDEGGTQVQLGHAPGNCTIHGIVRHRRRRWQRTHVDAGLLEIVVHTLRDLLLLLGDLASRSSRNHGVDLGFWGQLAGLDAFVADQVGGEGRLHQHRKAACESADVRGAIRRDVQ